MSLVIAGELDQSERERDRECVGRRLNLWNVVIGLQEQSINADGKRSRVSSFHSLLSFLMII